MNNPPRIGLTGGIGSGKTTCAQIFMELGIPVYSSDDRAKQLMNTDPILKSSLIGAFGFETYLSDGTLNREFLSKIVFGDPEKVKQINAIVHPAVRRDFESWAKKKHSVPYILQESALLFEIGSHTVFDKMILVDAPIDLRVARVMRRDNVPKKAVVARMSKQWSSEKKRALAHYIIENDGHRGLIKQVINIHLELQELRIPTH